MNCRLNSTKTQIDFFPQSYSSESPFSEVRDFDHNVKEYSKSLKFNKIRQE